MKVIGLTGGIASGKSTVSEYLRSKGAVILDADAIAHELAEPDGILYNAYRAHFGESILLPDGCLDRAAIGKLVFANPAEKQWIDSISHPLIRREIERLLRQKKKSRYRSLYLMCRCSLKRDGIKWRKRIVWSM